MRPPAFPSPDRRKLDPARRPDDDRLHATDRAVGNPGGEFPSPVVTPCAETEALPWPSAIHCVKRTSRRRSGPRSLAGRAPRPPRTIRSGDRVWTVEIWVRNQQIELGGVPRHPPRHSAATNRPGRAGGRENAPSVSGSGCRARAGWSRPAGERLRGQRGDTCGAEARGLVWLVGAAA